MRSSGPPSREPVPRYTGVWQTSLLCSLSTEPIKINPLLVAIYPSLTLREVQALIPVNLFLATQVFGKEVGCALCQHLTLREVQALLPVNLLRI